MKLLQVLPLALCYLMFCGCTAEAHEQDHGHDHEHEEGHDHHGDHDPDHDKDHKKDHDKDQEKDHEKGHDKDHDKDHDGKDTDGKPTKKTGKLDTNHFDRFGGDVTGVALAKLVAKK